MKYSKLNKKTCKYPDRTECDRVGEIPRCEFMKYIRDGSGFSGMGGHWECKVKYEKKKIC